MYPSHPGNNGDDYKTISHKTSHNAAVSHNTPHRYNRFNLTRACLERRYRQSPQHPHHSCMNGRKSYPLAPNLPEALLGQFSRSLCKIAIACNHHYRAHFDHKYVSKPCPSRNAAEQAQSSVILPLTAPICRPEYTVNCGDTA